jgi:metal-responsive CopG/Arc/MetJ family transcriptional regulator
MPQLTVRLPDDLSETLDAAAERLHRKRAEIVRMALRSFLGQESEGKPSDRVRGLLGSLESGLPDLAENHRRYVLESLTRES